MTHKGYCWMNCFQTGGDQVELVNATIFGFGKWQDFSIDFSQKRFICIYGENESGKSTLHQFILFILFGFPPKKRAFYQPKTSGKMGGRLTVNDVQAGTFTIERLAHVRNGSAICHFPDGREMDEKWLQERLKGMTYKTYQSIFSFSATDLDTLTDMKEADLGEVLLEIGLTGAKNIYELEKKLDKEIGDLFKPFGKKPLINRELDSLQERYKELHHFRESEATYREKKEKASESEKAIQHLQWQLGKVKQNVKRTEKKLQALPIMRAYETLEIQLSGSPKSMEFPENGLERLDTLKEMLLPWKSEISVLETNIKNDIDKQKNLKREWAEKEIYQKAQEISRQKQDYLEVKKEIMMLQETIGELSMRIQTELNDLNINLLPADLSSFSFPFHLETTWDQLKTETNQLKLEKEHIEQDSTLESQHKNLLAKKKEKAEVLLTDQQAAELETKIEQYKQQDLLQKTANADQEYRNKWEKHYVQKEKKAISLLAGNIIFALLSIVVAAIGDFPYLYALAAVLAMIGIGQWLSHKRSVKELKEMLESRTFKTSLTKVTSQEKDEAKKLLAQNKELKNELSFVHERLKTNEVELLQRQERKNTINRKENWLDHQIKDQQLAYPFLEKIEITHWPELYHTLKNLSDKQREINVKQEQKAKLQEKQIQTEAQLEMFLLQNIITGENDIRKPVDDDKLSLDYKPIEEKFALVDTFLETYRNTDLLINQYANRLDENREKQLIIKQKMHVFEKEMAALYEIAHVNTEESFIKKGKQQQERRDLRDKQTELEHQLSTIFSGKSWKTMLHDDSLHESTLVELEERYKLDMENLETALDKKRQELADINATLATMESSEEFSQALHRTQMELDRVNKLAREWAVLKTAKEMLAETKRDYCAKYAKRVIDKTSYFFSLLTNHHYKQVVAPADGNLFQVISREDIKYTVAELSKGTRDQLYIALRIAIGLEMSSKHCLPFIIDDAFVHFDNTRTKRMMDMLHDISSNRQIIVFTCKKEATSTANQKMVILKNSVRIN